MNDDDEEEDEEGGANGRSEKPAVELPDYIKNDENYSRKHGSKYTAGDFLSLNVFLLTPFMFV